MERVDGFEEELSMMEEGSQERQRDQGEGNKKEGKRKGKMFHPTKRIKTSVLVSKCSISHSISLEVAQTVHKCYYSSLR